MIALIDQLNSVYMSFSMARREIQKREGKNAEFTKEHLPLFYHMLFNKYNKIFKTYGRAIICHEGERSLEWRRSIYPGYKLNREQSKQEEEYKVFKSSFPVIEEALTYYPTKQIKVEEAEADDVIYALAKKYAYKGEHVTIISSDKDLTQLMSYSDLIEVYNPLKNKVYEHNPTILLEKAIIGDPSDGIPGLRGIGKKTLEKMLQDNALWKKKIKGNEEILEAFLQIINLSKFPEEWRNKILEQEENTEWQEFNPNKIELIYFENQLHDQLMRWTTTRNDIYKALEENC